MGQAKIRGEARFAEGKAKRDFVREKCIERNVENYNEWGEQGRPDMQEKIVSSIAGQFRVLRKPKDQA